MRHPPAAFFRLQDCIRAHQGLSAGQGALGIVATGIHLLPASPGLLQEGELAALVGQVRGVEPNPHHAPGDPPGRVDPGPQLPPHPFGQRVVVERVDRTPHPSAAGAVSGFHFDQDPKGRDPLRRQSLHEPHRQSPAHEGDLVGILQRILTMHRLDGMVGRDRPGPGQAVFAGGQAVGAQPHLAEP